MTRPGLAHNPITLLLAALICAAGAWLYAQRVLVKYQIADAEAHGRPRGNLSDLYPRWFGARELLLNGRDPYGADVTRDIQQGYYGRPLDSAIPTDLKDQQKFVYPLYVVFLLAPTIHQSFDWVRREMFWVLLVCTIAAVLLWLQVLRWALPCRAQCAIVVLTLGSLPVVQGLKLQQLTLFVAALLALSIWLFAADHQITAGVMLAVATIKPQLVAILLLWLFVWTLADFRRRFRWLLSFLVTMAALAAASEHFLPHWLPRFFGAVRDYRTYTDAVSVFTKLVPAPWNIMVLLLTAAATFSLAWQTRAHAASDRAFAGTAALVLAATVILIPSYALYNQVLLVPALLWLARERGALWNGGVIRRSLLLLAGACLLWPWITAVILAAVSFFVPPETVEKAWAVPFWTALLLPVGVAALVLVAQDARSFAAREMPGAS
jgi:hypothetical protein